MPPPEAPAPPSMGCRLTAIEISGFKCFKQRVHVGPFGPFTCVVGPNGCGKSVVGEALAFALGGTRRMLRATRLDHLINQQLLAGTGQQQAEVIVHFEAAEAETGMSVRTSVRRVVRPGGSTETSIRHSPSGPWQAVKQDQLRAALAPLGLQTNAVDRFIVTQSRQAVAVADPVALALHLEELLGNANYPGLIAAEEARVAAAARASDELEDEEARLQDKRARLAPEVARWRQYRAAQAQLQGRRLQWLQGRVARLGVNEAQLEVQAARAVKALAKQEVARGAAATEFARLEEESSALGRELKAAESRHRGAAHVAERSVAERAKLQAEAAAATAASAAQSKQAKAVERKVETSVAACEAAQEAVGKAEAAHSTAKARVSQLAAWLEALQRAGAGQQQQEGTTNKARVHQVLQAALGGKGGQGAGWEALLSACGPEVLAEAVREGQAKLKELQRDHERSVRAHTKVEAEAAAALRELQRLQAQQQAQEQGPQALEAQHSAAQAAVTSSEQEVQAAAQASQAACEAHLHAQVQVQYAAAGRQRAADELAACTAELAREGGGSTAGAGHSVAGRPQDRAVEELCACSQQGKLPGRCLGRLCNVARLAPEAHDAGLGPAVNAALAEACSLGSTLLVSDRQTAYAAVALFSERKAGVVTCRVLEEVAQHSAAQRIATGQLPAAVAAAKQGQAPLSLTHLVLPAPGAAEVAPLLAQLLGGWALVRDTQAAAEAQRQQRRGNGPRLSHVTLAGEVFKADGEVVGPAAGAGPRGDGPAGGAGPAPAVPYGLGREPVPVGPVAADVQGPQQRANAAAARQEQQQNLCILRAALVEAEALLARCVGDADAKKAVKDRAAKALQLAQTKLREAKRQAAACQQALATARRSAAGPSSSAAKEERARVLEAQAAELCTRVQAGTGALTSYRQGLLRLVAAEAKACQGSAASELSTVKRELQAATEQEQQAKAAVAAARAELRKAQGKTQALQAQLSKLLPDGANGHCAAEVEAQALRGKLVRLEEQASAAEARLQDTEAEAAVLRAQAAAAARSAAAAQRVLDETTAQHKAAQSQAQATSARHVAVFQELHAAKQQLADSLAAAKADQRPGAAVSASTEQPQAVDGGQVRVKLEEGGSAEGQLGVVEAPGRSRRLQRMSSRGQRSGRACRRRAVVESSSSEEGGGSSDSRSSGESGPTRRPSKQARTGAHNVPTEAWLEAEAEALADEEAAAEELRAAINAAALEEDLEAATRLQALSEEALRCEAELHAACASRERLVQERYRALQGTLEAINGGLSQVYQFLTGRQGDAYLGYTAEPRLLFANGVVLNVRPDQHHWRMFHSLSGGQQALASLALSFAMQRALPAALYFFDEVDCALDMLNAQRVAEFILAELQGDRAAQYIVVSHRPQVFERAGTLVGVYSYGGAGDSLAATQAFPSAATAAACTGAAN